MSSSREAVLGRIRLAIGRKPDAQVRARAQVEERLARSESNLLPARGQLDDVARVELFVTMAEKVGARVRRLQNLNEVPEVVTGYLREHNLPQKLVIAPDPLLDACGWESQPLLRTHSGTAADNDPVGLTIAQAGVAETSTLMLASAPERPTLLAFLPETSIVLLSAGAVFGAYEQAIAAFAADNAGPPRSINFITGPSRTGDIAQKIELGAHGPKRLLVLLLDDGPA